MTTSTLQAALIGSPNCGKTTLFNRLTGAQQTTGNWPGVTVSKKTGRFSIQDQGFEITDLPGVYSLENASRSGLDEAVARQFLQTSDVDLLINVVDATCLERQLFLTAQLLHMGLPVIVVLNGMDKLESHHLKIDTQTLSDSLGCPVIPISAYYNQGIDRLKEQLPELSKQPAKLRFELPVELHAAVHRLRDAMPADQLKDSCWQGLQFLTHPHDAPEAIRAIAQQERERLESIYDEEVPLIVADLYFTFAHDATHSAETRTDKFARDTTESIDKWVLHPVFGVPIFLIVMYLLFAFSITLGNIFIDFFDQAAGALFVDGPTHLLESIHAPGWLIALLATGIGGGLQVVATFIPVIGALFLLLSVLEETGYMQRAALVMDRAMRRIGLSGQAFIPLVVGFGCNIPAVLATRTLPDERDRIMTALMTPFMSCGARLTVYVLFATAFFADHATLFVFSLYLIGILAAVLTALVLKKTLLPGEAPPILIELPSYHKPAAINILLNTNNKMKSFITGAGKVIVVIVLAINFFNSLGTDGTFGHDDQSDSVLSYAAKTATPLVEPLGVTEDNWPATVGLITGILAKEVVVGTLNALYQNMDNTSETSTEEASFSLSDSLLSALQTIPDNASGLVSGMIDPLGLESLSASDNRADAASELEIDESSIAKMAHHFGGEVAAYAYLLLVLLYFPCVATLGAMRQELGWKWTLYSGGWSLLLGYSVAVSFYQIATFSAHPVSSSLWLFSFAVIYAILYWKLKQMGKKHSIPLSSD